MRPQRSKTAQTAAVRQASPSLESERRAWPRLDQRTVVRFQRWSRAQTKARACGSPPARPAPRSSDWPATRDDQPAMDEESQDRRPGLGSAAPARSRRLESRQFLRDPQTLQGGVRRGLLPQPAHSERAPTSDWRRQERGLLRPGLDGVAPTKRGWARVPRRLRRTAPHPGWTDLALPASTSSQAAGEAGVVRRLAGGRRTSG